MVDLSQPDQWPKTAKYCIIVSGDQPEALLHIALFIPPDGPAAAATALGKPGSKDWEVLASKHLPEGHRSYEVLIDHQGPILASPSEHTVLTCTLRINSLEICIRVKAKAAAWWLAHRSGNQDFIDRRLPCHRISKIRLASNN